MLNKSQSVETLLNRLSNLPKKSLTAIGKKNEVPAVNAIKILIADDILNGHQGDHY